MKINLSVQSFDSLITSGGAGLLSLCLLMRSSLFSTYRLDIKEAKEGRRGELRGRIRDRGKAGGEG